MKILALEFSSAQRSVAIFDSETRTVAASVSEMGGRSTQAFSLIEKALLHAAIARDQIDCLAIGLGPGSYTGIRAAIAIAQGWQLGKPIKLIGVSSVAAIAAQAQTEGISGTAHIVVDAQRNEFYLATFELAEGTPKEVETLKIVSADVIHSLVADDATVLGPDLGKQFGAANLCYPEAAGIARLAAESAMFTSGDKLEPIYLRETSFIKAPPARIIA